MTPLTVAHQAPPSMGFSKQEYWTGFPFPSPVDLPNPGIESRFPALQADALLSKPPGKLAHIYIYTHTYCCYLKKSDNLSKTNFIMCFLLFLPTVFCLTLLKY